MPGPKLTNYENTNRLPDLAQPEKNNEIRQMSTRVVDPMVQWGWDETGRQVNTVLSALETKTVETPLTLHLTKTDQKRGKGRKRNNVTGPSYEHRLLLACGQDPKSGRNFQKAHLDTSAQSRILCAIVCRCYRPRMVTAIPAVISTSPRRQDRPHRERPPTARDEAKRSRIVPTKHRTPSRKLRNRLESPLGADRSNEAVAAILLPATFRGIAANWNFFTVTDRR